MITKDGHERLEIYCSGRISGQFLELEDIPAKHILKNVLFITLFCQ